MFADGAIIPRRRAAVRRSGDFMRIIGRYLAAIALLALGTAWGRAAPAASLIENVHGYTLIDQRLQTFDALLCDRGKVVSIGHAAALHRSHPRAQPIDGGGKTLLPGLIDAHGHVMDLGFETVQIQLAGTPSLAAAQVQMRAYVRTHPGRSWYLGDGWNQVIWSLGRFPLASELDAVIRCG
jgi:hypothetical protein